MTTFGEVGAAYVRIRPDLTSFRREAEAGIRSNLRSLGTLRVPGLQGVERQFQTTAAAARASAESQVTSLRIVRSAREQEARANVAASIRERRALLEQLQAYRAVAASAVAGSRTQVEANNLAAASAERLGVQLTVVEHRALAATGTLNKLERGALAGSGALRGMGRSVAFASLGFIGAYGLVGAIRSSIEEAGELNNEAARSETIFRGQSASIREWSEEVSPALGFAKSEALGAANSFGTMLTAMTVGSKQAVTFSEDLTRVAAAISLARGESDPDRATAALRVALAGRGRALRQYGIILDDTTIKAKAAELGLVKSTVDPEKLALAQNRLAEAVVALQEARAKGTPLQAAKASDAVTVAQGNLRKEIAGTTGEVTKQAKAVAAHAIIMEQGQRFIDRYGASLDTAAGRSRRFHEGIDEMKEELGTALYPSFAQAVDGINAYITSLREGGSRHEEFTHDLHDAADGAHALYAGLKTLGQGFVGIAHVVGGFGNLVEILGLVYAANKALQFAAAIKESRIALFLLGAQAPRTAAAVVLAEQEMAAGTVPLLARLGSIGAGILAITGQAAKLGAAAGYIVLLTELASGKHLTDPGEEGLFRKAGFAGITGFVKEVGTFGQAGGIGPKRDLSHAQQDAAKLRLKNLSEELIYRELRRVGYTRGIAVQAIITTREHPGGAVRPPSPEDVRFTGGPSPVSKTPAQARALAGAQIDSTLGSLAKKIETGGTISLARAKSLAAQLAVVTKEIADGGFGPKRRAELIAEVTKLTTELANATAGIGTEAVKKLRADRAEIAAELKSIGADIAQARVDMATAISDAIKSALTAERDAVAQAKQNLNSLGSSLSDFINRFLDAQDEKAVNAPSGPLARRLERLTKLIAEGRATPELIREAQKVEHELNEQSARQAPDSQARKDRVQRRLADLTAELNEGKISIGRFNREVAALLKHEGINYKAAGRTLGFAFAEGFRVALKELKEQAAALIATPVRLRRQGTGFESGVVKPNEVIREQTANINRVEKEQQKTLRDLIARRHELLLKEQRNANEIARSQRRRTNELLAIRNAAKPPKPQAAERPPVPERRAPAPRARPGSPEDVRAGHNLSREASLHIRVKADDESARREVGRVSRFVSRQRLQVGLSVFSRPEAQTRAVTAARIGGHVIGSAVATGIALGMREQRGTLASQAARTIRHVIDAAKKAAGIGSPSRLAYDEIGVPLNQGIERAIIDGREGIGATLSSELRRVIRDSRREVEAAQKRAQRPTAPPERRAIERPGPERRPAPRRAIERPEPPLRRAAPRRPVIEPPSPPALRTARPAEPRRVIERVDGRTATQQRSQLLTEARHTNRTLERILVQERRAVAVLTEVELDVRKKRPRGPLKNPRRATEHAQAATRNNLLG